MTATSFATPTPPAIVLGGAANAASVARSLGGRGVDVHVLAGPTCPARWSRYVRTYAPVAGPAVQEQMLDRLTQGPREGVLVPCDDEAVELIARHRAALVALGYAPVEGRDEVLLALLDKRRTYALAEAHGIPAPRAHVAQDAGELAALAADVGFPLVLKPVHAHLFARRHPRTKAIVVSDVRALEEAHGALHAEGLAVLLCEIVPGPEDAFCSSYTYLDEDGTPLVHANRHKLRQHPPGFGSACYATNRIDPEASALGLRFLQAVGLRGIGNVEFKRDARDGQLKLIECNPRLTAGDRHLQLCGVDLPLLAYCRAAGIPAPPMEIRRTGVHIWHPIEDTRAYLAGRGKGGPGLAAWGSSLLHRQRFPVADLRDPLPTFGFHALLARRVIAERVGRSGWKGDLTWKGRFGEGLRLRPDRAPRALRGGGLAVASGRRAPGVPGVLARLRGPLVRPAPDQRQGDRRPEGPGAARAAARRRPAA